jgi:predicted nucleic acid-binding protein
MDFVDTNVLVYALDEDQGKRHETARALVEELWDTERGVLSTQVLQELYVTLTRKLRKPMTRPRARAVIERYAAWPTHQVTPADILAASELEQRHSLAFWDALIIVAAQRMSATRVVSEDMQADRAFGAVRVYNPFVSQG